MNKKLIIFFTLLILSVQVFAQTKSVTLSGLVDTSSQEVKDIVFLIDDYFNSNPDSNYNNPYFYSDSDATKFWGNLDNSAQFLFSALNSKTLLSVFEPMVLWVEPVHNDSMLLYDVKIIFIHKGKEPNWMKEQALNPMYILSYYACLQNGKWVLRNKIDLEQNSWNNYSSGHFNLRTPKSYKIDTSLYRQANDDLQAIAKFFELKIKPFNYYLTNDYSSFCNLFNFDYFVNYIKGVNLGELGIASFGGDVSNRHEFVHQLYPPITNYFLAEGLASWIGGVNSKYVPLQLSIEKLRLFTTNDTFFKDVYNNKIRLPRSSELKYTLAAVLIDLVYKKKGLVGVKNLLASTNDIDSVISTFCECYGIETEHFQTVLIQEIEIYKFVHPIEVFRNDPKN
jgi:hypothetical protein